MLAPKPYKRASARTAEECLETFKSMLAFDWDLKEISNLKHSPCKSDLPLTLGL